MEPRTDVVKTSLGDVPLLDFGGTGTPVLLVHDVLDNAAVWSHAAQFMADHAHPIAIDIPGHGQNRIPDVNQPQMDALLGEIVTALGMDRALMVGEGVAAWSLTSALVNQTIDARALLLLETPVIGDRASTHHYVDQYADDAFIEAMSERFALGWTGPIEGRDALVDQFMDEARSTWGLSQQVTDVRRLVMLRSFIVGPDGLFVRQPTPDALMRAITLDGVDRDPFPSNEAYSDIDIPITFLMASMGAYDDNPASLDAIVETDLRRKIRVLPSYYNLSATHPEAVAAAAAELIAVTSS